MRLSDLDYELPAGLIAQQPLTDRSSSRLLIVDRRASTLHDGRFHELPNLLRRDDLVVLNNTKVFPARLIGQTETGANVEVFLVKQIQTGRWEALAKPAKRLKIGRSIRFSEQVAANVNEQLGEGRIIVEFEDAEGFDESLE